MCPRANSLKPPPLVLPLSLRIGRIDRAGREGEEGPHHAVAGERFARCRSRGHDEIDDGGGGV